MIEEVTGSFFDYEAGIRINTVNCVGVMGAGAALQFKVRYPDMFRDYVKACKRGEVSPGHPHVWEENTLFSRCLIVNLPTKVHWRAPSEYSYIEAGLAWLRDFLRDMDGDTVVTMPALGCGNGGLDWTVVREMIFRYLRDLRVKILLFPPGSSNPGAARENRLSVAGNGELLGRKKICLMYRNRPSEREAAALRLVMDELGKDRYVFLCPMDNRWQRELVLDFLQEGYLVTVSASCGLAKADIGEMTREFTETFSAISGLPLDSPGGRYGRTQAQTRRVKMADAVLVCTEDEEELQRMLSAGLAAGRVFYVNFWPFDIAQRIPNAGDERCSRIGIAPATKRPNVAALEAALA